LIFLENVVEWKSWCPLGNDGQPDVSRLGETFRAFVAALRDLGYAVEWRELVSADYGAPTTRKRLFLIARRDGPIVWPEPTHGPGRPLSWRTAAEVIDWSIPMRSIFDRPKPLAEATQRRIAEGMRRFVFEDPNPFILKFYGTSMGTPLSRPLDTITAGGGKHALCIPSLIQTGYGERAGQAPRVLDLGKPLGTVVAGGSKHAIVGAWLAKHYGGVTGHGLNRPLGTVTTVDHHAVCGAVFAPDPPDVEERARKAAAFIVKYYGQGGQTSSLREPLHTIVTKARHGLVTVEIDGTERVLYDIGMRMLRSHELAMAQGFPPSYVLHGTEADRIRLVGNSVSPQIPLAIAEANLANFRRAGR
jgi:DNA (cytosine-5)-methyltransferase 1